jgi:hypothetical protein
MSDRMCKIEGCDKPRTGKRRVCSAHQSRLSRTGSFGTEPVKTYGQPKPQCSMPECDIEAPYRSGLCPKHETRVRRHGDPNQVMPPPAEDRSGRWAGDDVTYKGAHSRVEASRGRASSHSCTCGKPAQQWAYDHQDPNEKRSPRGPYSIDIGHYQPMCASCHKRFDNAYLAATTARGYRYQPTKKELMGCSP